MVAHGAALEARLCLRELGQLPEPRPAAVLERLEALDLEPLGVGRLLAARTDIGERDVRLADMVEDAVDDHAHAVRLQFAHHREEHPVALVKAPGRRIAEILVRARHHRVALRAEVVVDVHEGRRVVLVVARRLEHGIQVDRVHAERLEIRNARAQALEVAAVVAPEHGPLPEGLAALRLPRARRAPRARPRPRVRRVVHLVAVREAVEHDLVPDRVARPVGCCETVNHALFGRHVACGAPEHQHRVEAVVAVGLARRVRRVRDPRPVDHELVGVAPVLELDRDAEEAVAHPLHRRARRVPSVELACEKHRGFRAFGAMCEGHLRAACCCQLDLDRLRQQRRLGRRGR